MKKNILHVDVSLIKSVLNMQEDFSYVTNLSLPFLSFNTRSLACPSGIFAINSGMFCLHETALMIYKLVKHLKTIFGKTFSLL